MANNSKSVLSRPKVRFSQSGESPNSASDHQVFTKPRVTSVIDFKRPCIKICKVVDCDFGKNSASLSTNTNLAGGDAPNDLLYPAKSICASVPRSTKIVLTPQNEPLRTENVVKTGERQKSTTTKASSEKITPLVLSVEAKRSGSRLAGVKSAQGKLPMARDDKENVRGLSTGNVPTVRDVNSKMKSAGRSNSLSSCPSRAKQALERKLGTSGGKKVAPLMKEDIESCLVPEKRTLKDIGLMPCMKGGKVRNKSGPTKKTIVRDATASCANIPVGPGVPKPMSPEEVFPTRVKALRSRSEILSGDKLVRPEYNSIVSTMKKLQDLREARVIKDLGHLPAVYRGLVNGKVSSALDFGANEAIYHDLVDLSIDEKQLPTRLTRSKDPEPRQKDLVPKLSDFFVPTNDDEYRKAVLPKPPIPRVLDTSNPFKISDRIFAWKESLDDDS